MIPVMNATDVRKDWSAVVDTTVRVKPQFIKRTRDYFFFPIFILWRNCCKDIHILQFKWREEAGSVTLALNELDLVENGKDENDARTKLAAAILEYAEDYYKDFSYWGSAPNRRSHIPYVFKALFIGDVHKIGESIRCQAGKT